MSPRYAWEWLCAHARGQYTRAEQVQAELAGKELYYMSDETRISRHWAMAVGVVVLAITGGMTKSCQWEHQENVAKQVTQQAQIRARLECVKAGRNHAECQLSFPDETAPPR